MTSGIAGGLLGYALKGPQVSAQGATTLQVVIVPVAHQPFLDYEYIQSPYFHQDLPVIQSNLLPKSARLKNFSAGL